MDTKNNTSVAGIYAIKNTSNNKAYIGSAVNIENRWYVHRHHLRNGMHHSVHLQRAWDAYGEHLFSFEILEQCIPEELVEREQYWIDRKQSYKGDCGYNCCPNAGSQLGYKFTDEQKAKLRYWNRGKLPHAALVTYKGETKPRVTLAKEHGLSPELVAARMNGLGWTIEQALETPVKKTQLFTFNGKTQSLKAWSKETGIPHRTLAQRLYHFGWSVEEALTTIARPGITYNGETKLIAEWARQFGLKPYLLQQRLSKGMPMEEAIKPARPKRPNGSGRKPRETDRPVLYLTAFGKTQRLSEWAKEYGIKHKTIWSRLQLGWTIEEALQIPPGKGWHPRHEKTCACCGRIFKTPKSTTRFCNTNECRARKKREKYQLAKC